MIYMEKRRLAIELVNFLSTNNRYAIFRIANDKQSTIEIQTNFPQSLNNLNIPEVAVFLGDERIDAQNNFVKLWYRKCIFKIISHSLEE